MPFSLCGAGGGHSALKPGMDTPLPLVGMEELE